MSDLVLGDTPIAPSTSSLVRLPIARLPTGTLIDLPVFVFRGQAPGPGVLVQGGLHGDELNGVEILRRMLATHAFDPPRGTILVVPVINVFGFLHFERDLPDGKDVNRSFPGSAKGSLASRVARTVTDHLLPHVDVAIDLHTGGGRRENAPQARYTEDSARSRELAEAFAAPYRFASGLIDGSFRQAAHERDVAVVVYEGGESLRLHRDAIDEGIAGILRLLAHLGMGPPGPAVGRSLHLARTTWARASRAGLFAPAVRVGETVQRGEVLGTVTDPYNVDPVDLVAPRAGHVISLNHLPIVHQGDALVRVGVPDEG